MVVQPDGAETRIDQHCQLGVGQWKAFKLRQRFSRSLRLSCPRLPSHFATSRTNGPTWPPRCLFLRQIAANSHKFWNTRSKSTRVLEKYPLSVISTFMRDPGLNSQYKWRSSGWALPTMATVSHPSHYTLSHSAPFGLLLRFLKPRVPGCDSGSLRLSNFVVGHWMRLRPLISVHRC